MNIQIFGKSKCFDTKKAERYFKERGIKYQYIDVLQKGLSKGELESVIKAVGGIDKLANEKSPEYHLFIHLTPDAKPDKMSEKPSLYKTPIIRNGKLATIGYNPNIWKTWE